VIVFLNLKTSFSICFIVNVNKKAYSLDVSVPQKARFSFINFPKQFFHLDILGSQNCEEGDRFWHPGPDPEVQRLPRQGQKQGSQDQANR
jgi:hypothetical protein